jgi:hypothetical protein
MFWENRILLYQDDNGGFNMNKEELEQLKDNLKWVFTSSLFTEEEKNKLMNYTSNENEIVELKESNNDEKLELANDNIVYLVNELVGYKMAAIGRCNCISFNGCIRDRKEIISCDECREQYEQDEIERLTKKYVIN